MNLSEELRDSNLMFNTCIRTQNQLQFTSPFWSTVEVQWVCISCKDLWPRSSKINIKGFVFSSWVFMVRNSVSLLLPEMLPLYLIYSVGIWCRLCLLPFGHDLLSLFISIFSRFPFLTPSLCALGVLNWCLPSSLRPSLIFLFSW